jgi:hypothetical protein
MRLTRKRPITKAEHDAYATGCHLAGRIADLHPDIANDLGALIEAVRTEQRLASQRGQPIR